MANAEQVSILKQGADCWNEWREKHPDLEVDLREADLREAKLCRYDLSYANMNNCNLEHADLEGANLDFASLQSANLSNALLDHCKLAHARLEESNFFCASLKWALLPFANLRKADLSAANLSRASAEDSNFEEARLLYTILEGASLASSSFKHAHLSGAVLSGANLSSVNLEGANVSSVEYDRSIFRALMKKKVFNPSRLWAMRFDLILDTTIRCKGINASTCYGSQRFKLFLQDQDFLEEFLEDRWKRRICYLWWLSSNCGRSLARWASWSVLLVLLFACIYRVLGPAHFSTTHLDFNFLTLIYYSVVTFTTLGFGDVLPRTNTAAGILACEVILGYVMLGGLLSIFATKLARRGG